MQVMRSGRGQSGVERCVDMRAMSADELGSLGQGRMQGKRTERAVVYGRGYTYAMKRWKPNEKVEESRMVVMKGK